MQIEGFRHLNRSAADRADEARRTGRSDDSRPVPPGTSESSDTVDTSIAAFIDGAVRDAGRQLDARIESLAARREELLALADDPAAIRRAAHAFLRGDETV